LNEITRALSKFVFKVSALLAPLGAWGVFAVAALDGLGIPMPGVLDVLFVTYIHNKPGLAWLYVIAASVGSSLGCLGLYFLGYESAELVLRKRMSPEKFERTRLSFEKNRVLALLLPAMLPPPFPFKIFVFSAAIFEMKVSHFLVAIIGGRIVRFAALAAVVVFLGPDLRLVGMYLRQNLGLVALIIVAAVTAWLILRRVRRTTKSAQLTTASKQPSPKIFACETK
jgi:membrane protein YqaA with SNARE-associated domain